MKAQIFSSDMIAAITLFLAVASTILIAWNSIADNALQEKRLRDMELSAARILDILVKTPGYPEDWENGNASVIGLASSDRTIDKGKLDAFMAMDYTVAKKIFGIHYDYFFRMGNYTKGVNGKESVLVRRMVVFNGAQLIEFALSWSQ